MPYLICEECNGYYELQEGESPENFDHCQCGGNLKYFENMDDYAANEKRNYDTDKSRQYGNMGIYNDIESDKTHSYLEKRDKKLDPTKSKNLVVNAAFIILSFTIFPLELYVYSYYYIPFIIMTAFTIILALTLFYFQNAQKVNTIGEIKKIYGICGSYFLLFFIISLIWILTNLSVSIVSIINVPLFFVFVFAYTLLFSQRFIGNYLSMEISDPLDSLGLIKKFIYYVGVFMSVAWFIFAIFAAFIAIS